MEEKRTYVRKEERHESRVRREGEQVLLWVGKKKKKKQRGGAQRGGVKGREESRYPGNSCCGEEQMAPGGAVMAAVSGLVTLSATPGRPQRVTRTVHTLTAILLWLSSTSLHFSVHLSFSLS